MKQYLFLTQAVILLAFSCSVDKEPPAGTNNGVAIATNVATNIGIHSATLGGKVSYVGIDGILERGICWSSSNGTPTYYDSKLTQGTGIGEFSASIAGLTPATVYYARAYVRTNLEIVYGNTISFKTFSPPTVITLPAGSVTASSAVLNGNIADAGGVGIPVRGICWGNNPNPTIIDNYVESGTGTGFFSITITNLVPLTTYYVRAFAVLNGTRYYGQQVSFTTLLRNATPPTVSTDILSGVSSSGVTGGGLVSLDGGGPILERGVCWNTSGTPTTAQSRASCGAGTGAFSCSISSLFPNTTYYVRAYAQNSAGVSYGEERVFTTFSTSSNTLVSPALVNPAPSAALTCCSAQFGWQYVPGATHYEVQVSKSLSFSGTSWIMPNCGANKALLTTGLNTLETSYNFLCIPLLNVSGQSGVWYWRVRAKNNSATGPWSSLRSFYYSF